MDSSTSYKRIWQIAYPIILGSMTQNLINFTDTAFLGRVGEVALGAGALGGLFYLAVFMLALGFGMGEQIIVARRFGEKNLKEIGVVVNHSLIFLLGMAILAFLLLRFGSIGILHFGVKSHEIYEASLVFLAYRSYGIFFAFVNVTFRSFYVGIGQTKVITYTTFVLATVNIILDYVLIFGNWGFPKMGIAGAALASTIAEAFGMIYFIVYTRLRIRSSDFGLFRQLRLRWEKMLRILKIAAPTMAQQFISLSVWFVFFLLVEKIGKSALAVSNIIRSVYVLLMVPIWGFATASNTLVSYLIGQGHSDEVMKLIFRIVSLCFIGVLIIVSFGMAFPRLVLEIYTNNAELINLGIPVLRVVSLGALLLSVGFILFSGVSGTGKTNISLAIELLVLSLYVVYTYALIQVWHVSISMAWTAEWLYGLLLSLLSYFYLRTNRWKAQQI